MYKKEKLLKVAKLLEQYLQAQKNNSIKNELSSVVYVNSTQLLIGSKNLKEIKKREAWLDNSKLTKQAKMLVKDIFVSSVYAEQIEQKIFSLFDNNLLKLIPDKQAIIEIITHATENLKKSLWNENSFYFEASFTQGRQHRKALDKQSWKKYVSSAEDIELYNALSNVYKRNIFNHVKINLQESLIYAINQSYDTFQKVDNIKSVLSREIKKFHSSLNNFMKNELVKIYSMGNLCQIKKEGYKYVTLQASQDLHDCEDCREIQGNEKLLKVAYVNNNDYNCYDVDDIIKKSLYQGNQYITHDGCRCQFIPIKMGL